MAEIKINPSNDFHNYKIEFAVKNEDSTSVSLFTVLRLITFESLYCIPGEFISAILFLIFMHVIMRLILYDCQKSIKKNDLQSTWYWEISFLVL